VFFFPWIILFVMIIIKKGDRMKRSNIILSVLLAIIFLATQIIAVGAAPAAQEEEPTIISGTVDNITVDLDASTVTVKLTDEEGTQTVTVSLDDAIDLEYVIDDGTGNYIPNEDLYGTTLDIDSANILSTEEGEEKEHPVGSKIADFFSSLLGVDYETVMDYHEDGVGFGVITQALWMTNALEGDTTTFSAILDAKQSKDFSAIPLPDGSTPENWGQFRKAVMSDREKSKENLGAIMSGHADNGEEENETEELVTEEGQELEGLEAAPNNGKAPDKEDKNNNGKPNKNNDKGKSKDKGKSNK